MATKKPKQGKAKTKAKAVAAPEAPAAVTPEPAAPRKLEPPRDFPIVAIGASAGGIEAILTLLGDLPPDPGMAFVIVVHQDPSHPTLLPEVLGRTAKMPVIVADDAMPIAAGHLYLAPHDSEITIEGGVLRRQRLSGAVPADRIDALFQSLAYDQGPRAIAVVLSGAASDGAAGARMIKAEGGITFAQDQTARFDAMPRAAMAASEIDFVLPPGEIARELVSIARNWRSSEERGGRLTDAEMAPIFSMLQKGFDVDFTHYKPSTLERRIRRRMALQKLDNVEDYVALLREKNDELRTLYSDVLIRVTAFFRDPSVFDLLQKEVLAGLLNDHGTESPLRIWVPGCATGEEVYSLAITALEAISSGSYSCPVQIFGTDVSDEALDSARAGIYPDTIADEVPADRLRRYFTRTEAGYRISKEVRDCCIFARQNLTKDPPFSRLDLISCRNVMIYLGSVLQRKVMSIFHYALRPGGYLLLGASETIGKFSDLFEVVDRKHKLYRRRSVVPRLIPDFEVAMPREVADKTRMDDDSAHPSHVFREADRVLLGRYSPPGILINDAMDIVQFRGRTAPFLEPAPGTASFNIMKMAREGLLADLRTAIYNARKSDAPVRREGIRLQTERGMITVTIEAIPFTGPGKERYQLVLFEEIAADGNGAAAARTKKGKKKTPVPPEDGRQVTRLKRELEATREYLQSIIEEQEAMNEELRSANEEIQSSNEELQSTNEELETAKEELQSSNEELTTLNEELEVRNQELAQANNDLLNILSSVDLPIVMLDSGLRIRRFNLGAQRVLRLIPSDVGRSIADLKTPLTVGDELEKLIVDVIDNLEVREQEVQDRDGRWYSLRIRPYKTMENRIDGAVLVMVDIRK